MVKRNEPKEPGKIKNSPNTEFDSYSRRWRKVANPAVNTTANPKRGSIGHPYAEISDSSNIDSSYAVEIVEDGIEDFVEDALKRHPNINPDNDEMVREIALLEMGMSGEYSEAMIAHPDPAIRSYALADGKEETRIALQKDEDEFNRMDVASKIKDPTGMFDDPSDRVKMTLLKRKDIDLSGFVGRNLHDDRLAARMNVGHDKLADSKDPEIRKTLEYFKNRNKQK